MEDAPDAANGRRILLSLIVAVLVSDVLVSGLSLAAMPASLNSDRGYVAIAGRAGRFLLTTLLLLMAYRGNAVAVLISIGLFGLGALLAIPATLENPLVVPLLVLYALLPGVIMFSEDVGEFLEQQRSGRRSNEPKQPLS
ncbi:hypothetical protein AYO47_01385 [Planctomyces sp. SCGC AG-212-M04]|nr:hypothetical protein AYO47_01385 [Planctomyces sp. SCGC AG-212-M04]